MQSWTEGIRASIMTSLLHKNGSSVSDWLVSLPTGMRGLCNGLGPALFGLVFWLSDVHLSGEGQTAGVEQSFNSAAAGATNQPDSTNTTAAASTAAPAYEVEQNPVSLRF